MGVAYITCLCYSLEFHYYHLDVDLTEFEKTYFLALRLKQGAHLDLGHYSSRMSVMVKVWYPMRIFIPKNEYNSLSVTLGILRVFWFMYKLV